MEDLDVGSKFKKFEAASTEDDLPERRNNGSDRYGIMEKLKRLQDGEDLGMYFSVFLGFLNNFFLIEFYWI